jgi:hypothetical protein
MHDPIIKASIVIANNCRYYCLMAGSCERGIEHSGSTTEDEFLD